jgi:hypothetical protein
MNLLYPVPLIFKDRISFTFQDHIDYAIKYGLSYSPGMAGASMYYPGIDYAVPYQTRVTASQSGTVVKANVEGGYGNLVKIQHADNFFTLYAHLDSIAVKIGDVVSAGQLIGCTGFTGNVRPAGILGTHLHFEVRIGTIPTDPTPFLVEELNVTVLCLAKVLPDMGLTLRTEGKKGAARAEASGILPYSKQASRYQIDQVVKNDDGSVFGHIVGRGWICFQEVEDGETSNYVELTTTGGVSISIDSLVSNTTTPNNSNNSNSSAPLSNFEKEVISRLDDIIEWMKK